MVAQRHGNHGVGTLRSQPKDAEEHRAPCDPKRPMASTDMRRRDGTRLAAQERQRRLAEKICFCGAQSPQTEELASGDGLNDMARMRGGGVQQKICGSRLPINISLQAPMNITFQNNVKKLDAISIKFSLLEKFSSFHSRTPRIFFAKMSALGPLPEDTILATMDVDSLYSNIPYEDGIAACKHFLQKNNLATEQTLHFIRFVLHHNYFSFGNNLYKHCMGSAMESKMSPQYANLLIAKLEEEFLSSCSVKPLAYFGYIDDLLIIWTGSKKDLLTFHNNFNKYHPTIKLTLNFSKNKIHFLDMTIYIKDNAIQTSIYHKPTGRLAYLRWNSFHPRYT
ncbi:unnamed protein product [Ranitomeya imitator]|uniref:Reverse transcriptase domain-containing protein n=1 Tax=Ranitomeya imitator TaxID=111125 RepID=A0ABN9KR35_9NEOB|nr:unnamed protein product [Ranitomeya imitator]